MMKSPFLFSLLCSAFLLHYGLSASETVRSWYVPTEQNTPSQSQISVREGNLFVKTGKAKSVSSPRFSIAGYGTFSRPYRMRFRCAYRTEQYKGQGIGLNFVQYDRNGRRMGTLSPVIRVTGDHSCYLFNDSKNWKGIDVLVDFGNVLPDSLALEWSFFVPKGILEMRDLKVDLIEQENHRITGGEIKINSNTLRHVFFSDEGTLNIQVAFPEKKPRTTLRLLDANRKELSSETIPCKTRKTISGRGYYIGIVEARYPDGKQITTEFAAAILGKSINRSLLLRSRYGLMVVNGTFDFARKLGARWDWRFFSLSSCKVDASGKLLPPKRENNFHKFDETRIPIYAGGNDAPVPKSLVKAEHRKKNGLYPPADWDLYRKAVEAWAKAHPDMNGKYLCVVNEPDFRWYGTTKELADVHRVFAEAVRKIHPGTKVMGPVCSRIKLDFMKKMAQYGLFESMDGIVMHCYVDGTRPEDEFWTEQKAFFNFLKEIGKRDMPLHYTEFGWTTWEGTWQTPVDEVTQARYLTRSMALLSSERVDSLIYFCDFYNTRNRGESGFSILRRENDHLAPKPSVAAYMTLTRNLTGVIGCTRLFSLTPDIFLVTGKRDRDFVQLLWHATGSDRISLPFPFTSAENYLGGKEKVPADGWITVSESPLYLFSASSALYDAKESPRLNLVSGAELALSGTPVFLPREFRREQGKIRLPYHAKPGAYSLILRENGKLRILPVQVENAVTITETVPVWNGKENPRLRIRLESKFSEEKTGTLSCAGITRQIQLKKGTNELVLDLGNLRKLSGNIVCSVRNPGKPGEVFRTEKAVNQTFYSMPILPKQGIRTVTPLPASEWTSPKEKKSLLKAKDCRPELRIARDRNGIHVFAEIIDDEFAQPYQQERMWLGDSLQLAFDVDASKEWDANNQGFGFKGHRCFEFTIGLTSSGVQTYCHYAYDPVQKPGMVETVTASVTRKGNITTYHVFFPWKAVGLQEAPRTGSRFGFAAAVNDLDSGSRKALCLFQGIVESKDPVRYASLYLTE